MSSEAQKRANKNYRNKIKPLTFAVQYNTDKIEGERLKQYLQDRGQTANSYIKAVIKSDLDSKGIPYPNDDNEVNNN